MSLDSTLAELIDDGRVYQALMALLRERVPETVAGMVERMGGRSDVTLRQAVALMPTAGALESVIESALAEASVGQ